MTEIQIILPACRNILTVSQILDDISDHIFCGCTSYNASAVWKREHVHVHGTSVSYKKS